MKNRNFYTITFIFLTLSAYSYAQWNTTPSPTVLYRYDDVYFINPLVGWAINYANTKYDGMVIKTIDGGQSWQIVLDSSGAAFRDIGFTDSLHGWIGTLKKGKNVQDTVIMYQTTDGGMTWSPVENFPGPADAGICGICVINDSTVYACGRYSGPAGFYKTTNKGQSWSYTDMSAYAGGLVDIHFTTPDSGFVVGSSGTWNLNSGRILFTADGGNTWDIMHTSSHTKEICWKVSFPSASIGYVSLESFRGTGPQYFLKTTDGGLTWQDISFTTSGTFDAEGIGFINDNTGWIGGSSFNYKTTDGGLTWSTDNWGSTVNRFRFLSDSLGYAAGAAIYKFEGDPVSTAGNILPESLQVYPNPFSSVISIAFQQQNPRPATLSIRSVLGQTIFNEGINAGNSITTPVDLSFLPSGIYLLDISLDGEHTISKIVKE